VTYLALLPVARLPRAIGTLRAETRADAPDPRREEAHNMATLTSAALAAHELGLAATFGGIVFGQSGLGKAVKVLPNENDRSKVLEESWRTFAIPKAIGVITAGATWLVGRSLFSGRFMGKGMRRLVLAKDIALGITVLSGLGAQVVGQQLSNEQPFPVQAEGQPSQETPERAAALERTVSILGFVQLLAAGTTLVLTSALNIRGQRNPAWNVIARALP
jgi:hypothetical protein